MDLDGKLCIYRNVWVPFKANTDPWHEDAIPLKSFLHDWSLVMGNNLSQGASNGDIWFYSCWKTMELLLIWDCVMRS